MGLLDQSTPTTATKQGDTLDTNPNLNTQDETHSHRSSELNEKHANDRIEMVDDHGELVKEKNGSSNGHTFGKQPLVSEQHPIDWQKELDAQAFEKRTMYVNALILRLSA